MVSCCSRLERAFKANHLLEHPLKQASFQAYPPELAAIHAGLRQSLPAYTALSPSSSSMRMSWLYLALRSERHGAPVLIWPVQSPTARSAMVVSSVSPERCEVITPHPLCLHIFTAFMDS